MPPSEAGKNHRRCQEQCFLKFNLRPKTIMQSWLGVYILICSDLIHLIILKMHFTVPPKIKLLSKALFAEEGKNVTIACTATGQPQPSVTWTKAFGSLPKGRTEVLSEKLKIYNVTKEDRGTYICKAKNILRSARDSAQLTTVSCLRFKVCPPQELTPVIGYAIRLPCLPESDLRPTITWLKNGKPSLPVDSDVLLNGTLVLQNIKKSQEGIYSCRSTNALTTIEAKARIHSPVSATSCSMIRKHISSVNGNYVIDPDGEGGLAPFTVFCDMIEKNGVGVTVIGHDSESRTFVKGYKSGKLLT